MMGIIAAMAAYERDIIRERVVSGISAAKKKGRAVWPAKALGQCRQDQCAAGTGHPLGAGSQEARRRQRHMPTRLCACAERRYGGLKAGASSGVPRASAVHAPQTTHRSNNDYYT